MLRRRMMLAQGGVSLPAGYTKIEYLESDGNSYIDTGYKPNNNTRVVMDFQLTDTSATAAAIFGGRSSYTVQDFSFWFYNGGWLTNFGTTSTSIQSDVTGRYVVDKNKLETKINGKSVNSITAAFQSPVNLFIFAVNEEPTIDERLGKLRIYSCQIYDNGVLIRDFIPAMNASGEAGLYDLKNDVWYTLLPVAKPKVANKISTWIEFGDGVRYGVESQYPLASDVTVLYEGEERWAGETYGYVDSKVMSKGIQKTTAWEISRFILGDIPTSEGRTISAIRSISPTEDDTYIYTF